MRIGIFTDTYPPFINGVSTSIVMLKNALEKKGHQVYVVTVNNEKLKYKYEDDNKVIRIPGVPTGIYDYRLTGAYPLRAVDKIRKWDLDVIHSQTEFGIGTFARIIAKQFNIPLVHTYHTMYEDYTHYINKGFFDGASKKLVEYLTLFYCDKTISELIVPTPKAHDLFKNKYKVKRDVHIIPTGIEVERFYREKYRNNDILPYKKEFGIYKNDFIILFVGRIAAEKNIIFLLDAHKEIKKTIPNAKLMIIGSGPDLTKYQKYVLKNKLDDNVIFTGKVPWEKVPYYYQLADIFATASTTETQGLTVLEAMAASVCPVCINDESFTDVIDDKVNGCIFKNKKQYKDIIVNLYNHPEILKEYNKQARVTADRHSSRYFAESVLKVYERAKAKNPKDKYPLIGKIKSIFKRGFNHE